MSTKLEENSIPGIQFLEYIAENIPNRDTKCDSFQNQNFANNYIFSFLSWQVDRLEDELMLEQEKHKGITEELEQTFAEMSGY